MKPFRHLPAAVFCATFLALFALSIPPLANADVITLKDGRTVEGKITVEGTDMVRIEVQVNASIKETKTFSMTEVAKIEKTAPDKIAFAKIKDLLPTPPLMSSADYQELIRTGPEAFLKDFPESEHVAEVKAIAGELKSELEKVLKGGIKLGNDWVDSDDRQLYRYAVEARVRLLRMRQKAEANNLLGALRDFEQMGDRYAQTPAYVAAIEDAKNMIAAWNSGIQRTLSNVDIINQRENASLQLMVEDQRRQVTEARIAEKARYDEIIKREKDQDMTWLTVNNSDRSSLESAAKIASDQLEQLNALDAAGLKLQAEMLTDANRLIGVGDLKEARLKIAEAANKGSSKSKSRSRSRSSKSKGSSAPTSYSQWLLQKIEDEEAVLTAEAQAKAAMAAAKASLADATDGVVSEGDEDKSAAADGEEGSDPSEAAADDAAPEKKKMTRAEIMAAENEKAAARKAAEAEESAKQDDKNKSSKKKSSRDDDEDEEKPARPARSSSGGGINFQYVIMGLAAVLVITVLVMKKLGVGTGAPKSDG